MTAYLRNSPLFQRLLGLLALLLLARLLAYAQQTGASAPTTTPAASSLAHPHGLTVSGTGTTQAIS